MNYVVMRRSFIYDDEYYCPTADDSGKPVIVFTDREVASNYSIDLNVKKLSNCCLRDYIIFGMDTNTFVGDLEKAGVVFPNKDYPAESDVDVKNCNKEEVVEILKRHDLWFYNVIGLE